MADPPATADDDEASLRRWETKCEGMPAMTSDDIARAAAAFRRIEAKNHRNNVAKAPAVCNRPLPID